MILPNLDINLKRALVFSLILNSALAFSGFYARTYDSYAHMFFADHYRRTWFDTWEPRWYTGFSVTSYPPLAHQTLALLSYITGLELAYTIITLFLMFLFPLAVFRFSKVFVSAQTAGYASLISVFLPGFLSSVYVWGQYTTLFSLVALLFAIYSFNEYVKRGGLLRFIESICFFEATIASHHFSGIIFAPLLLLVTFLTILIQKVPSHRTSIKRFLLFLGASSLLSLIIVHPILFGAANQNVHIPHPSTLNYFLNGELFSLFFINMYGFILLLIPLTIVIVRDHRDLQLLLVLAIFFLILGLGGTTPLPQVIFGENWLGLTYERFNLFSGIAFMPLIGGVCMYLRKRKTGRTFLMALLVSSILFSGYVGNSSLFLPRPKEVPVEPLVSFLDRDEHWKWRYLTLGFYSSDFSRISILSNATTLDGWYYRGRDIKSLASSGVSYFGDAKFEENGILVLRAVLENASQYNLKFVFCNDRFYEPLLNETGFRLLEEKYEQVTIWYKDDIPQVESNETKVTDENPTLTDYLWGIIPMIWLTGALCLIVFRNYKTRKDFSYVHFDNPTKPD